MNRINDWIREIESLPEFIANGDVKSKLQWLDSHMLEYIERWTALASITRGGVKATLANDLFYLVMAGADLINRLRSVADLDPIARASWERFIDSIDYIQDCPRTENVHLLLDAFNDYLACIEH